MTNKTDIPVEGPYMLDGKDITTTEKEGFAIIATINEDLPNAKANGQVLAASWEMLESCKEWLEIWLYLREKYPEIEIPPSLKGSMDACGRLRTAIEKATGVGTADSTLDKTDKKITEILEALEGSLYVIDQLSENIPTEENEYLSYIANIYTAIDTIKGKADV